jgi:HEAT repeat protein
VAWRTRLIQLKNKLPAKLRNTETARRLDYDRDYARQLEALYLLEALGAGAAPAVPDVAMVVTNRGNGYQSHHSLAALLTLTRLGPPAVPALTNLLADFTQQPSFIGASTGGGPEKRLDYRIFMIGGLRDIGAEAAAAIPALLETMKSTNAEIVLESVTAVGSIRRHPELVVPALVSALDHSEEDVRVGAAKALASFGKDAVTAIPNLKSMNREFGKVGKATRRAVHVIDALAKGEEPDPDY